MMGTRLENNELADCTDLRAENFFQAGHVKISGGRAEGCLFKAPSCYTILACVHPGTTRRFSEQIDLNNSL